MYYSAFIPIRSGATMWPKYPVTEQVGTVFRLRNRMGNLLPCDHVLHKTLVISRFFLGGGASTEKKCAKIYNVRAAPLLFSLNPIVLWRSPCRRRSSFLNSLINRKISATLLAVYKRFIFKKREVE